MLDRMTPEEFEERWLADSLDPIDDSWLQTATIASTVANKLESVLLRMSGKTVTQRDLVKPTEFIPKLNAKRKPPHVAEVDAEQIAARWQSLVSSR